MPVNFIPVPIRECEVLRNRRGENRRFVRMGVGQFRTIAHIGIDRHQLRQPAEIPVDPEDVLPVITHRNRAVCTRLIRQLRHVTAHQIDPLPPGAVKDVPRIESTYAY